MAYRLDEAEFAAAELECLGVHGRACWSLTLHADRSGFTVSPSVEIAGTTYRGDIEVLRIPEQAAEWAQVVATHARGVRA